MSEQITKELGQHIIAFMEENSMNAEQVVQTLQTVQLAFIMDICQGDVSKACEKLITTANATAQAIKLAMLRETAQANSKETLP